MFLGSRRKKIIPRRLGLGVKVKVEGVCSTVHRRNKQFDADFSENDVAFRLRYAASRNCFRFKNKNNTIRNPTTYSTRISKINISVSFFFCAAESTILVTAEKRLEESRGTR
jgi:hypothetical protein